MLETESSEGDAKRTKPSTLTTVLRHPRINGYNRVRADGLRAFESGTEAFGLAAPPWLGCREPHTPWSAHRTSVRLSPPETLTFYSRVTVSIALPTKYPFYHRASTVNLRYYVSGWSSLFTMYFRLLKSTLKTSIIRPQGDERSTSGFASRGFRSVSGETPARDTQVVQDSAFGRDRSNSCPTRFGSSRHRSPVR